LFEFRLSLNCVTPADMNDAAWVITLSDGAELGEAHPYKIHRSEKFVKNIASGWWARDVTQSW